MQLVLYFQQQVGGCSGFNYNLKLLEKHNFNNLYGTDMKDSKIKPTIIEKNNIKIFVDPKTEIFLYGTTINYIPEDYEKGVFENKFIFIPDKKLATSCGCGISFTPNK